MVHRLDLYMIQFISTYSQWEIELLTNTETVETMENLIHTSDVLLQLIAELSERSIEEINQYVNELDEINSYYNSETPTSFYVLMRRFMESVELSKDEDDLTITLNDRNLVLVIGYVKTYVTKRLDEFEGGRNKLSNFTFKENKLKQYLTSITDRCKIGFVN